MITAIITLKSESGSSIFDKDAIVTAATIGKYLPSKYVLQKAKRVIKAAGFEVVASGAGLSISGTVQNFEQVFDIKFTKKKQDKQEFYRPEKKIKVPVQWQSLIESIDFSEPAEFY